MKHTEGPWVAKFWGSYSCVLTDGNDTIATVIRNEADARLIAKAPEMAALLRKHLGWHRASGMPTQETEALLAELEEHE